MNRTSDLFFSFCENMRSQPYLCFWGRRIQWWHFQNSTTTGWPRKSSSNRKYWNFKVTHLSPLWNFMISPIFMFSRSRNAMVTLSELWPPPVDLENPVRTGSTETSRLPIFLPCGILWFHLYLCFRGREMQWWHFQNLTTTGWPRKSSLNRKYWNFKVTDLSPWWNFMILPIFMFSRSRNSMDTLSHSYRYRVTSKIHSEPEILELQGCPYFSNWIF